MFVCYDIRVVDGGWLPTSKLRAMSSPGRKPPPRAAARPPALRRVRSASSAASGSAPACPCRTSPACARRPTGCARRCSTGSPAWPAQAAASCRAGTASMPSPAPARWASRPPRAARRRCCCASRMPHWSRQLRGGQGQAGRARRCASSAATASRRCGTAAPGSLHLVLARPAVREPRSCTAGAARRQRAALRPDGVIYLEARAPLSSETNSRRSALALFRHLKAGAVHAHLLEAGRGMSRRIIRRTAGPRRRPSRSDQPCPAT